MDESIPGPSDGQAALEKDITMLLNKCNIAGQSSLVVPGEYLEVVIVRK